MMPLEMWRSAVLACLRMPVSMAVETAMRYLWIGGASPAEAVRELLASPAHNGKNGK